MAFFLPKTQGKDSIFDAESSHIFGFIFQFVVQEMRSKHYIWSVSHGGYIVSLTRSKQLPCNKQTELSYNFWKNVSIQKSPQQKLILLCNHFLDILDFDGWKEGLDLVFFNKLRSEEERLPALTCNHILFPRKHLCTFCCSNNFHDCSSFFTGQLLVYIWHKREKMQSDLQSSS